MKLFWTKKGNDENPLPVVSIKDGKPKTSGSGKMSWGEAKKIAMDKKDAPKSFFEKNKVINSYEEWEHWAKK